MDDTNTNLLDGTLVVERLAAIGRRDDFFDAIDADDVDGAVALMKLAKLDRQTIADVRRQLTEL